MTANGRLVGVLIAIAVVVLGYLVLLHPIVVDLLPGGSFDPALQQAELENRQARLAQLEQLERQYADIPQSDLQRLARFLPPEADVPSIIAALEELTGLSGMQLLAVDTNPRKDALSGAPTVGVTDVALSVAGGDYPRLISLLRGIESNLRLFDVTALAFQMSSGVFAVNLRTYHLIDR